MMTREELTAQYPILSTLEPGTCYIAGIPRRPEYVVYIRVNGGPETIDNEPVLTIEGLNYESSKTLLNGFNNNPRGSLYGRVW